MGYLIAASFIWAFSYGLIKVNLTSLDPNFVTFCRLTCALPLFLPFLRIRKLSAKDSGYLIMIGAVQYGLMYLCFIRSFQYLNAHQAALFTTLTPFYVILINSLLSKKFSAYYLMTAAMAVVGGGIIYFQYSEKPEIFQGFLLVQGADICFAFGQVAYKKFRQLRTDLKDLDVYGLLFIGAVITAALSTSWFGGWKSFPLVTSQQLLVLIYLGTIASGICFFWWNKGAVNTNPGTLAVFNNLKSPLAILVSLLFFGEQTDLMRLFLGLSLIGFAAFLSERHEKMPFKKLAIHAS